MTGIAEDNDALMELIRGAMERLCEKDPKHELLTYIVHIQDEAVYATFVDRFGRKDVPANQRSNALNVGWMWAQYLVELRKALGEHVHSSDPKSVHPPPISIENRDEEIRIPF